MLNQDTKGRLAGRLHSIQKYILLLPVNELTTYFVFPALRSSRKRVREVIQTKFPGLISREFSCDQKDSAVGQCDKATASAHHARWSAMFDQMEKTLSEQENQLVSPLAYMLTDSTECKDKQAGLNTSLGPIKFFTHAK